MSTRHSPLPVIMYHTVGKTMVDWRWSYLTVPHTTFESHLQSLVESGYITLDLDDWHNHVSATKPECSRGVVLTFDDGYLDNWTFVAPLLKKYGCKATVFVNPEFVDPRPVIRKTLEDVWKGHATLSDLETRGFMSWDEMRRAREWGVLSIQSHLITHTWYPVSDEIVDFHHPGDDYFWLGWNTTPDRKPFYLMKPLEMEVPLGVPVYRNAKSMAATRYFISDNEIKRLAEYVAANGSTDFFNREDWKRILFDESKRFRQTHALTGIQETQTQRERRLADEIVGSKRTIAENLRSSVDYMAWPGGGYDEFARSLAQKEYKAMTIGSREHGTTANRPGDDPRRIRRIGAPYFKTSRGIFYADGSYLVACLDEFRGIRLARLRRQIQKTFSLGMLHLFRRKGIPCL